MEWDEMSLGPDCSPRVRGHLLDFDRPDAVYEQIIGASDQCLHQRIVQYRFWTAANSQGAGAGFRISRGNGASDAGLQNKGADRENYRSRLFAEDLFAGQ